MIKRSQRLYNLKHILKRRQHSLIFLSFETLLVINVPRTSTHVRGERVSETTDGTLKGEFGANNHFFSGQPSQDSADAYYSTLRMLHLIRFSKHSGTGCDAAVWLFSGGGQAGCFKVQLPDEMTWSIHV